MSLAIAFSRSSVVLILATLAAGTLLAAWFIVGIGSTQDHRSYVQTTHFIRVLMDERQKWLDRTVVDYADWGSAYAHLHLEVDKAWAYDQNNLGRTLEQDLGIEYVAVFDGAGDEVYTVVDGHLSEKPAISKLAGGVKDIVARAQAMNPAGHEVASGVLMANGDPILVSASILAAGDDTSVTPDTRPPSVLVFGDRLTAREIAVMRDGLHVTRLHFTPANLSKTNPADIFTRTSDGSAGFVLDVAAPEPGRDMLRAMLPWILIVAISLGAIVVLLARHGLHVAAMSRDAAAALANSHHLLEQQALHDPVTGLPNRAMATRHMQELLNRTATRVTILFLDLDCFKPINDTFGHDAGDFVLQEVSRRLQVCVRPEDLCARLGGDEFVIVMSDVEDEGLHRLCRRIIRSISSAMTYNGQPINVGVSIGIAIAAASNDTVHDILRRADRALYEAKAAGRSRYRWYDDSKNPARISA
jgi:diguanylate cyclase (GGDEF)-like protein